MKTNQLHFSAGFFRIFFFFIIALTFIQCRGPRGYDGYDGEDGIDGDVYAYSTIYDVPAGYWEGDAFGYYTSLSVPEINDNIFYNGAVLVYWLNEEAEYKNFSILPYSYLNSEGLTTVMACDVYVGSIDLFFQEIFEGTADTFAPENMWSFKVVIIEGIPLATVKSMVNIKDFNAVSRMFNVDKPVDMGSRVF